MVAQASVGSHRWSVKPEPQTSRNDATRESAETCKGETDFDAKRRAVLGVLGFSAEEPTVTGGNGNAYGLVGLFLRSEEHTSELQSLMRISYAVFCLKKKTK